MSEIQVAVMEPKYQQNLGYIARVSKNFGVRKLILINPRCNHKGKDAIKYSKHARDLLENATLLKTLKALAKDSKFLIGTTGVWHKTNASYYNVYQLSDISKLAQRAHGAGSDITILLGRDDTGLSREELKLCDATLFIQADENYPILNISHALAIMLQALRGSNETYKFLKEMYADSDYQDSLFMLFDSMLKDNSKIRDKKSVSFAFRHIVRRSIPTKKETSALAIAFASAKQKINRKRRRKGKPERKRTN